MQKSCSSAASMGMQWGVWLMPVASKAVEYLQIMSSSVQSCVCLDAKGSLLYQVWEQI